MLFKLTRNLRFLITRVDFLPVSFLLDIIYPSQHNLDINAQNEDDVTTSEDEAYLSESAVSSDAASSSDQNIFEYDSESSG